MILEKIKISGQKYYQWRIVGYQEPFKDTNGEFTETDNWGGNENSFYCDKHNN